MPAQHAYQRSTADRTRRGIFLGWLAYVGFVIYGSLLPFDYTPLSAGSAVDAFLNTPFLHLGIESRADWIANGVLYLPVGFLTLSWLKSGRQPALIVASVIAALGFCLALAFAVEFSQLYFPPRTVSRNDIIAEGIGSVIGILLAFRGDAWLHAMLATLGERLADLLVRLLQTYVAAYFFFSLFPFDFLLSANELNGKLVSGNWGWLIAPSSLDRGLIPLAAKLMAEVLCTMPLGALLAHARRAHLRPAAIWLAGLGAGLAIELAQFFIFSGVSEGLSLITRAFGIYGGTWLWQRRTLLADLPKSALIHRIKPPLLALYLLLLSAVNGWYSHPWHGLAEAGETLTQTRFIPLYYHYYTTEQAALVSLASVALMYLPLGLLSWLNRQPPRVAFWLAALVALPIETSKLFIADLHPDPTNLLIAAFAAGATAILIKHLTLGASTGLPRQAAKSPEQKPEIQSTTAPQPLRGAAIALSLACAAWLAIDFPFHPFVLASLLLVYAATIWQRPWLIWFFIPAALPLLDLAPWSGRFYWDEFDYLLLISIAIAWVKTAAIPAKARDRGWLLAIAMLAALFAIGALRGVTELALPNLNLFSSYYSPFNGLRQAKGIFFALLLALLWRRFTGAGRAVETLFTYGMLTGLAGVSLTVIWERISFPGFWAFSDAYRVTGPFSAMHVGGADLETYLTCTIPFALLVLNQTNSRWLRLAVVSCLLGAGYALMVSFSRIGYLGCAAAILSTGYLLSRHDRRDKPGRPNTPPAGQSKKIVWTAVAAGAVALAVIPFASGDFAQKRFALTQSDLAVRLAHWDDALSIRNPGLINEVFGTGLGRYPETHFWRSNETRAASYQLTRETDNTVLRLGAGSPTYIEQWVSLLAATDYRLELDARSPQSGATANILLCEKWLLTSANCLKTQVSNQTPMHWERLSFSLNSEQLGTTAWPFHRPIKLSITNDSTESIEIDNIRLLDPAGHDLLGNGSFSAGLDRWFMSVDRDLPWHVWSMPVAILFELGWFGVLTLAMQVIAAMRRMLDAAGRGNQMSAVAFSAALGTLLIGLMDTVIDAPRISLLLILLLAVGSCRQTANQESTN